MKLILFTLSLTAHAGWWSDFCERYLVTDDPWQYSDASNQYLERELDRLQIRIVWGKATQIEIKNAGILAAELERRKNKDK